MKTSSISHPSVMTALMKGHLVVLKTDTIYGILALATDASAVNGLYRARSRNPEKSCIILVAHASDIPGLEADQLEHYQELNNQRPTTLVVPVQDDYMPHLTRQNGTLAFRLIGHGELRTLIERTGPLLAPSANPEGMEPAKTIDQAIDYFGDDVEVYVDCGLVENIPPSRIMALEADRLKILRS